METRDTPEASLTAEARAAFDRVLLRAEQTRAGLAAVLFGGLTALVGLRVVLAMAAQGEALWRGVIAVLFLGGMAALEVGLMRDARSRLSAGRAPSDLAAHTFAIIEILAFMGGSILLGSTGDSVVVLTVALVALSAFRMIPSATILGAATAASSYLAWIWSVQPDAAALEAERAVWTAGIVFAAGGALAALSWAVRRAALRLGAESAERQRLQQDLLASVEATQTDIGRLLHDGVGSHLTGLSFYARGLVRRLERGEPIAHEEMTEAAEMVDEAVRQVRRLSRGLTTSEIEPGELPSALADLVGNATHATGVPVTLHVDDGFPTLARHVESNLYRIAQEAVTNALKHGAPAHVWVSLGASDGEAVLMVEDDGSGLPTTSADLEGVGMRSMRHRAEFAGGAFSVGAGAEGGTAVRVRVME